MEDTDEINIFSEDRRDAGETPTPRALSPASPETLDGRSLGKLLVQIPIGAMVIFFDRAMSAFLLASALFWILAMVALAVVPAIGGGAPAWLGALRS